ncbi:DUF1549 domain-containing protein [Prosthecobacter sp.]|uniref:DUF1549 domain-containing protein n=1 Tax=Prosthecobacter sp. TaxID=1965333 RepID=UPI0037834B9F
MKHLLCCLAAAASVFADAPQMAAARIDAALIRDHYEALQELRKHSIAPPPAPALPVADDAVFLRRACIDIAGRLPAADEVRQFLADPAPDKRARLTDALVREPGAEQLRFRILSEAFRVKEDDAFAAWLLQAAKDDRPFDQIIASLIGEGRLGQRDGENAIHTANEVAAAVLGEDLQCAVCHDHPYNDHQQKQCYEFAACFLAPGSPSLQLPGYYHQRSGKPRDLVKPRLLRLNSRENPPEIKHNADARVQTARWIVTESTHRFASVAALRVWSGLFGMPGIEKDKTLGGVDPAPSWNEVNGSMSYTYRACGGAPHANPVFWVGLFSSPAPAPSIYTALGEEFRRCGCRIGEFQRVLARTTAYNRAAIAPDRRWIVGNLVPAPVVRRLPAEVIWDALSAEKSSQLPPVPPPEHPLRMLGRGTREWSDESTTPVSHELVRFMMNSAFMENAAASRPADSSAEDLFLAILGRYPNGLEKALAKQQQNESPQTAVQDITWALLNTAEFMFRP